MIALAPWSVVLVMALSASGDDYGTGPPNVGYMPDSSLHTYCLDEGYTGNNAEDAANNKMANLVNQTNMSKDRDPSCTGPTDAKFRIANLTSNVDGQFVCLERAGNVCFSYALRFDRSNISSDDDWAQTACHEIGHSVGLAHLAPNRDDCMDSRDSEPRFRRYDDHHVDHINRGV